MLKIAKGRGGTYEAPLWPNYPSTKKLAFEGDQFLSVMVKKVLEMKFPGYKRIDVRAFKLKLNLKKKSCFERDSNDENTGSGAFVRK